MRLHACAAHCSFSTSTCCCCCCCSSHAAGRPPTLLLLWLLLLPSALLRLLLLLSLQGRQEYVCWLKVAVNVASGVDVV
jgi:hypothetical protein